jgi:hypothetical protein
MDVDKSSTILSPSDILNAKGMDLKFLILRQIDRTNFIFSIGSLNATNRESIKYPAYLSLMTLDSMIASIASEAYQKKSEELKEKIRKAFKDEDANLELFTWYSLIIKELSTINLLPPETETYEFEEIKPEEDINAQDAPIHS